MISMTHTEIVLTPMLAAAPPLNGGGSPAGGAGGQGTQPTGGIFGPQFLFIMIGLFVLMIFMSSRSQRKERQKREAMLGALTRHDRVQTLGGLIGTIVEIKDDEIILKVDESTNTRIHFSRGAVQTVLKKASGSTRESANELEPAETIAS